MLWEESAGGKTGALGREGSKMLRKTSGGRSFFSLKKLDEIIMETKGDSSSCKHRLFEATQLGGSFYKSCLRQGKTADPGDDCRSECRPFGFDSQISLWLILSLYCLKPDKP